MAGCSVSTLSDHDALHRWIGCTRVHAERLHTAADLPLPTRANGRWKRVLERASVISRQAHGDVGFPDSQVRAQLQAALVDYRAQRDAMTTAVEELRQIHR
jgi:hypothetical protein